MRNDAVMFNDRVPQRQLSLERERIEHRQLDESFNDELNSVKRGEQK